MPTTLNIRKRRTIETVMLTVGGAYALLPLGDSLYTKVDVEDWPELSRRRWRPFRHHTGKVYAYANGTTEHGVGLHRFVMKARAGLDVDHRDGDTLDNRKSELRVCERTFNHANRSTRSATGFKGVYPTKGTNGRYEISLDFKGQTYRRRGFTDPAEAARAYDALARQFFGEYARTNF
jgi:hypothetical protein